MYKYDIAISFVQKDELIAQALYKILSKSVKCFLYSEEQKRLAGKDGEVEFRKIFSKESRTVAVLFNNQWGTTNWTRVEQEAIRERAFEKGYDFVLFVPTEDVFTRPEWLAPNKIWIGLNRLGIENTAAVLEARVQEFGGEIVVESEIDKAARLEAQIRKRREIIDLMESDMGLHCAFDQLEVLKKRLHELVLELKGKTQNWPINIRDNAHKGVDVISYGIFLNIFLHQPYRNTFLNSYLGVKLLSGNLDHRGYNLEPTQPHVFKANKYKIDQNELDQIGWVNSEKESEFFTTNNLAEKWFDQFLKQASKVKKEKNY